MARRTLNLNLTGRVKKVKTDNFLVGLFEGLSNSIHAIEYNGKTRGKIKIEIIRNPRQLEIDTSDIKPITGFIIDDDGIGFNDQQFKSFCEADSTLKADKGGNDHPPFPKPLISSRTRVIFMLSSAQRMPSGRYPRGLNAA